ncbi:hypothetical protein Daus18300_004876 [Diaporthe australafricana]|uniref:Fe2OG dioxygenase domain-containing protein n=1 Tax=Diaporthe australafricana TaxID=127596 RepID=A0ABR3X5A7_9PEZI
MLPLVMKLVKVFALAFDLDETRFDDYFKFPITGMRALYYPPTPADDGTSNIGLGAHSDFSFPALEVLNQDGIWVDAPPKPGTFVCNVGQYLEMQSNGKFQATVHRVRNKTGHERYSLPFFLTLDPDVDLDVLDCCVDEGERPKYEKVNVGDLYIRKVLPARTKHPTSIKYKDVPSEELTYDILLN